MSKTIAIFLFASLLLLGVFGFLGFRVTAGTSCGFACPLTQGVLAFGSFFGTHSFGGSSFVILLLAFSLAFLLAFAGVALPKGNFFSIVFSRAEETRCLVFKKITFWFSLHEASPTK